MEMQNVYHGHLVISTIDENGWHHELFPVENAHRDGSKWAWDSQGSSLGTFDNLSEAIAEAKRRNPPEPLPEVGNVTIIEEKEGE